MVRPIRSHRCVKTNIPSQKADEVCATVSVPAHAYLGATAHRNYGIGVSEEDGFMALRPVVADGHVVVRTGLRALLDREDGTDGAGTW